MSWTDFKEWISGIRRADAQPPSFAAITPANTDGYGGEAFEPQECYIQIRVERMNLRFDREWWSTYRPAVYSFVSLAREGAGEVLVPFLAGSGSLDKLDDGDGRVTAEGLNLIRQTPYLGGSVGLAVGLTAVRKRDLLGDFMGVLDSLADVIGNNVLTTALSVVDPLKNGIEKLLNIDDNNFRLGLVTDLIGPAGVAPGSGLLRTGFAAVVDGDKSTYNSRTLSYRDGTLMSSQNGVDRPVREDYVVLDLRKLATFEQWSSIPTLNEKRQAVFAAATAHGIQSADFAGAVGAFKSAVLSNPDLIQSDRAALVSGLLTKARDWAAVGTSLGTTIESIEIRAPDALLEIARWRASTDGAGSTQLDEFLRAEEDKPADDLIGELADIGRG